MAHLKVVSAGAMVSPPTSQVDVLTPLQQLQLCMFGLQENGCLRHANYFAAGPGLLVSPSERADRVGASYERTSTPGVPGQTGPAEPGYGPDLQTTAPSAVQHPAKLPTSGHGPMSGSWPAFAHPTMQRQLNVPEMPQEFLQHHHQGHPCEQLVIWCGYEPGAEPTELIPGRQKHMSCRGSVHFARWLFAQARGQITPFSVLVVTWRDAKACLAAIRAAQTGNDADLRIDGKRPPLSQIIGHVAAGSPNVAVARVIIVAEDAKMHAQAVHLIKKSPASFERIRLQVCQVPLKPERAQPAQLEWQCPAWLQSPISGLSTASSSSSIPEASSWNSASSIDAIFGLGSRRLHL